MVMTKLNKEYAAKLAKVKAYRAALKQPKSKKTK